MKRHLSVCALKRIRFQIKNYLCCTLQSKLRGRYTESVCLRWFETKCVLYFSHCYQPRIDSTFPWVIQFLWTMNMTSTKPYLSDCNGGSKGDSLGVWFLQSTNNHAFKVLLSTFSSPPSKSWLNMIEVFFIHDFVDSLSWHGTISEMRCLAARLESGSIM